MQVQDHLAKQIGKIESMKRENLFFDDNFFLKKAPPFQPYKIYYFFFFLSPSLL